MEGLTTIGGSPMAATKKPKVTETPPQPHMMMAVNPELMKTFQEMMTEWGRFVTQRLEQDMGTQRAMLECTTPVDLMKVQTEFFQTAARQYSEETMRMMQMMFKAFRHAAPDHGTARKYDDVPL
jgi:hypothetical protein